jgi:hypothetical protein
LFDDVLYRSHQGVQAMGELLTLENLVHEMSFGPFESVNLLDGALDGLLNAAAYEKVHTGRWSQVVVISRNRTAMSIC